MKAKIDTGQISFFSKGENLIDYTIYGAAGGVGERTENLFNSADSERGFYLDDQGEATQGPSYLASAFIPVSTDTSYTISLITNYPKGGWRFHVALYDASQNFIDFAVKKVYGGDGGAVLVRTDSFTIGEAELIRFSCLKSNLDVMLNVGSQAMPYEPYGYKIPVTCGGETTNIYLDEPLYEGDSITFSTAQVNIPTNNGQNTLTVDTQVKPSKIMVKTNEGIFQNPPENKSFSDYHYNHKMDTRNEILRAWATKDNGAIVPKSWNHVQFLVRNNLHKKVFHIGDQLICQRDNVDIIWDIIGIDHDTPSDSQFQHSLTLQTHDVITELQFDAVEAMYSQNELLPAGTYNFTVVSHTWYSADVGKTFQFVLTHDVPAGGQIMLSATYNATLDGKSVKTYASPTSTTVIETATISEGSSGTNLGNFGNAVNGNFNSLHRVFFGSNNYKESALRQWLNSNQIAGQVWTPHTKWDRPPSWVSNTAGFMTGIDEEFLSVIGSTHIVASRAASLEGGDAYDEMDDKFFLLSRENVYAGREINSVNEGTAYLYYQDYSDLSAPGAGTDSNRIKERNSTKKYWWLRSPASKSGNAVCSVSARGYLSSDHAYNSSGVAPACSII